MLYYSNTPSQFEEVVVELVYEDVVVEDVVVECTKNFTNLLKSVAGKGLVNMSAIWSRVGM